MFANAHCVHISIAYGRRKRTFLMSQMLKFLYFFKGPILFLHRIQYFYLASPSANQYAFQPTANRVMLNLEWVHGCEFLTFHRPHINDSVGSAACRDNIALIFRHVNGTCIWLQNVALEFGDLLEINPAFALEFVVHNSFVEGERSIVVMLPYANSTCSIVIKTHIVSFRARLFIIFFPVF